MDTTGNEYFTTARTLMDDFLERTAVTGNTGNPKQRYLWTDAFAVQACFALYHALDERAYYDYALKLIDLVHETLGQYRDDDPRTGWISGLPEGEGKENPTANGLRIGKKLGERATGESYNQQLEWERDGQYFHYLTRWFMALLQAFRETHEKRYALWAVELIKAGEKFIYGKGRNLRMYWKMNTGLSEAAVESMGAHDPMEGLICTISAMNALPEKKESLVSLKEKFQHICREMSWYTNDPLGIGGLLLNTCRSFELSMKEEALPEEIQPEMLFSSGISGLKVFSDHLFDPTRPAVSRLAFRECGLSLGCKVLHELRDRYRGFNVNFSELTNHLWIARSIEQFWIQPSSHKSSTWTDHLDINAVTLAASILSGEKPRAFSS